MTAKKPTSPGSAPKANVRVVKTMEATPASAESPIAASVSAPAHATATPPTAAPKPAAPTRKKAYADDTLFAAPYANLVAAARCGAALTCGTTQFVHEMTEFLRHSLDMSVVNLRALMDSKDPAASVRLQAEFVNAAADRLFRQQARLSEIALQTATDAWTVVMARAEEALAS